MRGLNDTGDDARNGHSNGYSNGHSLGIHNSFDELLLTEEFPFSNLLDPRIDSLTDAEIQQILDKLVPRIVSFSYNHTPLIRLMMDASHLTPADIGNWSQFIAKFPHITLQTLESLGAELSIPDIVAEGKLRHSPVEDDLKIACDCSTLIPESTVQLKMYHTKADLRASAQGLVRSLQRFNLTERMFITYSSDECVLALFEETARELRSGFVRIPAKSAGEIAEALSQYTNYVLIIPPHDEISLLDVLAADTQNVLMRASVVLHSNADREAVEKLLSRNISTINYGDLSSIFPIDVDGQVVRFPHVSFLEDHRGNLASSKGRIILNKLLAVYELDNKWSRLQHDFEKLMPSFYKHHLPDENSASFGESVRNIRSFASDHGAQLSNTTFLQLYEAAHITYLKEGLRVGIASGSIMLRYPLSLCAELQDKKFSRLIEINPLVHEQCTVVLDKHLHERWKLIYGSLSQKMVLLVARPSLLVRGKGRLDKEPEFIREVLLNVIDDKHSDTTLLKHTHDCIKKDVLYYHRVTDEIDFEHALRCAVRDASLPVDSLTVKDVHYLLQRTYELIRDQDELQELFVKKSGIPLDQIKEQLAAIPSLISEESILKVISAAFGSTEVLQRARSLSPYFIVTPSNTNFYDGFLIFTHLLLGKLARQDDGALTFLIRPSESDLILTSIIYYFRKIAAEFQQWKEKGLDRFIQKVHWDPEICPDYLGRAIAVARGGMYFGQRITYEDTLRKFAKNISLHHVYGEGLNHAFVLPGPFTKHPSAIVSEILAKTYKLKSRDCTSLGAVLLLKDVYEPFVHELVRQTQQLNKTVNMGQYEKKVLFHTKKLLHQYRGDKIIGNVFPDRYKSDLVLNIIESIKEHHIDMLAMETPTPILNVVKVDSYKELLDIVYRVVCKSSRSQFTTAAVYGAADGIKRAEQLLSQFSQILKKNRCDFSPYEPHNGGFFVRELLDPVSLPPTIHLEPRILSAEELQALTPLITTSQLWY